MSAPTKPHPATDATQRKNPDRDYHAAGLYQAMAARVCRFIGFRSIAGCAATITVSARIASPENVTEPSSIASPSLLPLPHQSSPGPQFHFPISDMNYLLLWALWIYGRRASVVQA